MDVNTPRTPRTARAARSPRADRRNEQRPIGRRRLLASLVVVPVFALAVAACGSDDAGTSDTAAPSTVPPSSAPSDPTTPGTAPDTSTPGSDTPGTVSGDAIQHPTGADEVVITVDVSGGFVPREVAFGTVPSLVVTGDGRAITPGATTMQYPGPLVTPIHVQQLDPEGIQAILRLAAEHGLLGDIPEYEQPPVTDLPTTTVTIHANGTTYTHAAYALGYGGDTGVGGGGGDSAEESSPARQALLDFVTAVGALDTVAAGHVGEAEPYTPAQYAISATRHGTIDDDEELAQPPVTWPADAGVALGDAAECAVVDAAAVAEVLGSATQETRFVEGGATYTLAVRPLLPGGQGCEPAA